HHQESVPRQRPLPEGASSPQGNLPSHPSYTIVPFKGRASRRGDPACFNPGDNANRADGPRPQVDNLARGEGVLMPDEIDAREQVARLQRIISRALEPGIREQLVEEMLKHCDPKHGLLEFADWFRNKYMTWLPNVP